MSNSPSKKSLEESPETAFLTRRLKRERKARKAAEILLEEKSLELYEKNQELLKFNRELESIVELRTVCLEETLKKATAHNIAKGQFLSRMTHELRTPLHGVLGALELALGTSLTEEQHSFLKSSHSSTQMLLALIQDILDFSKIEEGQIELENIPLDLLQLLEETGQCIAKQAHLKNIEVFSCLSPETPRYIMGDPTRLRQILVNLAGNAVKFTKDGEISIFAKYYSDAKGKSFIRFEVKDSGTGIPTDKQAIIFDDFSQADETTTRKYGGTGLGLAICKQLSHLMKGEIGLSSIDNQGSIFWFTVPLVEADAPDDVIQPNNLENTTILIASENANWHRIISSQLKETKAIIHISTSAENTLEHYEKLKQQAGVCIVILDEKLHENDEELFSTLLIDKNNRKSLFVILFKRLVRRRNDIKNIEHFAKVLPKPVCKDELLTTIDALLHAESAETQKTHAQKNSSIQDKQSKRILLVEDHPVNQEISLAMLKKLGWKADLAKDGVEAVSAVSRNNYTLVLMDLLMPNMDGITATVKIRELPDKGKQPIIVATTANASEKDKENCLTAGMDDFLTKPFKKATLNSMLNKWL